MSQTDDFNTLARTLCNNPHRIALLKNAFQYQKEQYEREKAMYSSKVTSAAIETDDDEDREDIGGELDVTLFSGSTISNRQNRIKYLQPANDPFIIDNIFKTPKKRRRGLLSWSSAHSFEEPTTNSQSSQPASTLVNGVINPLWDFPRHVRARNRRRSILGTKHSLSPLRKRRSRLSHVIPSLGEHLRSASDPTSILTGILGKKERCGDVKKQPTSSIANSNSSSDTLPCSSTTTTTTTKPTAIPVTHFLRRSRHRFPFPKLPPSTSSSIPPPPPPSAAAVESQKKSQDVRTNVNCQQKPDYNNNMQVTLPDAAYMAPSTLRGVPGHPTMISTTSLSSSSSSSSISKPEPAYLGRISAVDQSQQRCTSLPPPTSSSIVLSKNKTTTKLRCAGKIIFNVPPKDIPDCLMAAEHFEIAPSSKFASVKNSFEIQRHLPLLQQSTATTNTTTSGKDEDKSDRWRKFSMASSVATCAQHEQTQQWLAGAALSALRQFTLLCGGRERGSHIKQ